MRFIRKLQRHQLEALDGDTSNENTLPDAMAKLGQSISDETGKVLNGYNGGQHIPDCGILYGDTETPPFHNCKSIN